MEISTNKIKTYSKAIFDYCIRVFVFLVLNNNFFTTKIMNLFSYSTKNIAKYINFELSMFLLILFWLFYVALTIKLLGIFNKVKKLYLPISFLLIMLINILFSYICPIIKHDCFTDIFKDIFFYLLPTYFFLHKFFMIKINKQK